MTQALSSKNPAEQEFEATRLVYSALEPLDDDARERVVKHVAGMLEINAEPTTTLSAKGVVTGAPVLGTPALEEIPAPPATDTPTYATFAELFDAAGPQTGPEKALVVGYWLQVCRDADGFDGFNANRELNHLGHKLPNITNAISALKDQRPSLAIQLQKAGTSQQARKKYKITVAGVEAVKAMLNGNG